MNISRTGGLGLLGLVLACSTAQADLSISNKPTQNMSCNAGVCTPTAIGANLNTDDLVNLLAIGDLDVTTDGTPYTQNIEVSDGFSWSNTSKLALISRVELGIHKPIVVQGKGGLYLGYQDQRDPELGLRFYGSGKIDFFDLGATLTFSGGNFTLVGDLSTLANAIAANPAGLYALANDYDAKDDVFENVPIPTDFSGRFTGLGHKVSHLKLNHALNNSEGLFARVVNFGIIRDVKLVKVRIESDDPANVVGSLVGQALNSVKIFGASASGVVGGVGTYMGGVEGSGYQIWNSSSSVNVLASNNATAGGVAGRAGGATNSQSTGTVQVGDLGVAGGLVGSGIAGSSYAIGKVTGGNGAKVGGIVGVGEVFFSFATGNVTAGSDGAIVGGVIGAGSSYHSYARGAVSGGSNGSYVGGASGISSNYTQYSYSTGAVSGGAGSYAGGFTGGINRRIDGFEKNYWDITTSGQKIGIGGNCKRQCDKVTGLTDQQLKAELPHGFSPKEWGQSPNINDGYPYLLANPPQ
jgi:hypothetical protein